VETARAEDHPREERCPKGGRTRLCAQLASDTDMLPSGGAPAIPSFSLRPLGP